MELEGMYDDSVFAEIISGDFTTKRMHIKRRTDSNSYMNLEEACAWTAEELIASIDEKLDSKVAYAMTYILLNSTIVYGIIGEQFLHHKFEHFSQEKYSLYIADKMFNNYSHIKRKQAIIEGIKDAINDKDNIYANAVKAAILSLEYFFIKKYEMSDDVEDRFFNNEVIPYKEVYTLMTHKEFGEFNEKAALHQLEIIYHYLLEHVDMVCEEFKEYFSNLTIEELIIFYIANSDIRDIHYIIQQIEEL
ncbi:MAG: hypothetical protein LUG12_08220 [Erysipelotrichaceae bacterium]|nr:hypothetical protein [Erysipelotrichaceae bacterium]